MTTYKIICGIEADTEALSAKLAELESYGLTIIQVAPKRNVPQVPTQA